MTRRQVIVQLDDELVAGLDEAAAAAGISRSELLRRAARALLDARRIAEDERRQVEGYRGIPEDPALDQVFARLAAETMEPW